MCVKQQLIPGLSGKVLSTFKRKKCKKYSNFCDKLVYEYNIFISIPKRIKDIKKNRKIKMKTYFYNIHLSDA